MVFDPIHYLPLIEQKINALDQAAPLAEWNLPPEFATLRRLMEARMIKAGRREYVQVLRLLESFGLDDLHAAVKKALQLGAVGFDAVKHLVLCQVEKRPPIARRSSRFSRSSAFIFSPISLETPARLPLSTSALLTQSFRVCGAQPIFEEIDRTACQRDPCWPFGDPLEPMARAASLSNTSRTARSRTSGENLFVVLLMMLHPTQELEPPANPARFRSTSGAGVTETGSHSSDSTSAQHLNWKWAPQTRGAQWYVQRLTAPSRYSALGWRRSTRPRRP
jgi:hypothetical protein